jgi:hypothetical protein
MKRTTIAVCFGCAALAFACGGSDEGTDVPTDLPDEPTLLSSLSPVTDAASAKPKTYIPPFVDCRPASSAATSAGSPDGNQICTPVSISGCTSPGLYFPDYASCAVVRTQRPYWEAPPANEPNPADPRLDDPAFARELAWVTEQVGATGCSCCHDSRQAPGGPSQWYIDAPGVWTDTVSNSGIGLFTGFADSSVLGAWEPKDNNGFERTVTGIPSNDADRMRAFFAAELDRRGITKEQAEALPPFGGSLSAALNKKPEPCAHGEGVDGKGLVNWAAGATARYVYVLAEGSKNPGVPPYRDRPEGAMWRLDVRATADPVSSGLLYGTTPPGSAQAIPVSGRAPALTAGSTYQLFVMRDVGSVTANCLFTYPAM